MRTKIFLFFWDLRHLKTTKAQHYVHLSKWSDNKSKCRNICISKPKLTYHVFLLFFGGRQLSCDLNSVVKSVPRRFRSEMLLIPKMKLVHWRMPFLVLFEKIQSTLFKLFAENIWNNWDLQLDHKAIMDHWCAKKKKKPYFWLYTKSYKIRSRRNKSLWDHSQSPNNSLSSLSILLHVFIPPTLSLSLT